MPATPFFWSSILRNRGTGLGHIAVMLSCWFCTGCPTERGLPTPKALESAPRAANDSAPSSTEPSPEQPSPTGDAASVGTSPLSSSNPEQSDSAASEPTRGTPGPYSIVVLGDSLSDPRSHGGKYLETALRNCKDARVENLAVGGTMVNQMRRRFEEKVAPAPAGTYTHLIVFGGVNDLYSDLTAHRTVEKITRDLSAIFEKARALRLKVITFTVAPWGGFKRYFNAKRSENTLALNDWIRKQEGALADEVVDAYSLLSCDRPERLCPRYEGSFRDGIHFGSEGHRVLGEALQRAAFEACP